MDSTQRIGRRRFLTTAGAGAAVTFGWPGLAGAAEWTDAEKANVKVVNDMCAAWTAPIDFDKIGRFLAEDCSFRASETAAPVKGRQAIVDTLRKMLGSPQKAAFEIVQILRSRADGGERAVRSLHASGAQYRLERRRGVLREKRSHPGMERLHDSHGIAPPDRNRGTAPNRSVAPITSARRARWTTIANRLKNQSLPGRRAMLGYSAAGGLAVAASLLGALTSSTDAEAGQAAGKMTLPNRKMRRIVTAHNAEGKSYIASDGPVDAGDLWKGTPERPLGVASENEPPGLTHATGQSRCFVAAIPPSKDPKPTPANRAWLSPRQRRVALPDPRRRTGVHGRHPGGHGPRRRPHRRAEHAALVEE